MTFKLNMTSLLARTRRQVGDVTLNLPFVSINVSPKDREREVAREIVIRLRDRRVLSAWECCDNCIDNALASLREIRALLVDKQVDLADAQDGPLFLLIDTMTLGIRQFMTYEELLRRDEGVSPHPRFGDFRRPTDTRQAYFEALEVLRGHLSRCLAQVATLAGMDAPAEGLIAKYQGPWPLDSYEGPTSAAPPAAPPDSKTRRAANRQPS